MHMYTYKTIHRMNRHQLFFLFFIDQFITELVIQDSHRETLISKQIIYIDNDYIKRGFIQFKSKTSWIWQT